ncbi:hypothetical protein C8F04DRAFT_1356858 [Mycena alexandri]|uniref:Uncharacterized protein n=1 Tax=Mycena alexandri TaxID=1745969 RepID=A0AAD6XDW1_9AGAR|nr:hypothetical protein C8F04DRAFT_1356858 [Mycena alexandri]
MYAWSYWIKYGVKKAGRTLEQHNFWSTPRVAGAHRTSLCSPLHSLSSSLAALGSLCARGREQHQNLPARLWGRRAPQAEQMGRTHPLHPPPHPPNLGGNARHVLRLWRGATSKSAPPAAARFWGPATIPTSLAVLGAFCVRGGGPASKPAPPRYRAVLGSGRGAASKPPTPPPPNSGACCVPRAHGTGLAWCSGRGTVSNRPRHDFGATGATEMGRVEVAETPEEESEER